MTLHVLHAIGSLELATLRRQGKINDRGKHSHFRMEKPGRNFLNQVMKVNPTTTEPTGISVLLIPGTKYIISRLCFLLKLLHLNLIMKKHQTNPK